VRDGQGIGGYNTPLRRIGRLKNCLLNPQFSYPLKKMSKLCYKNALFNTPFGKIAKI
jgi:hypothetical protein